MLLMLSNSAIANSHRFQIKLTVPLVNRVELECKDNGYNNLTVVSNSGAGYTLILRATSGTVWVYDGTYYIIGPSSKTILTKVDRLTSAIRIHMKLVQKEGQIECPKAEIK